VLSLSAEQISEILRIFSAPIEDTSKLFLQGVWGQPIIRLAKEDTAFVVLGATIMPNPILTIEKWMGLTNFFSRQGKPKGYIFESMTIRQLFESAKKNSLLKSISFSSTTNKQPEQIDLIIRLASTILVCELKCIKTPFDPHEHFNFVKALHLAAEQASRKVQWARKNITKIHDALKLSPEDRLNDFKLIPLVISNSVYGSGVKIDDCAFVDVNWLCSVLQSPLVTKKKFFNENQEYASIAEKIYSSEVDLERNIEKILLQPHTLVNELNSIKWDDVSFPLSGDRKLRSVGPVSALSCELSGAVQTHHIPHHPHPRQNRQFDNLRFSFHIHT
jgi:hypothetical protein